MYIQLPPSGQEISGNWLLVVAQRKSRFSGDAGFTISNRKSKEIKDKPLKSSIF